MFWGDPLLISLWRPEISRMFIWFQPWETIFLPAYSELLHSRGVDTEGIAIGDGETFRWEGKYDYDMKDPETVSVTLGVLGIV